MFTYLTLYPLPPLLPVPISLIVSVDVKHHVYLHILSPRYTSRFVATVEEGHPNLFSKESCVGTAVLLKRLRVSVSTCPLFD